MPPAFGNAAAVLGALTALVAYLRFIFLGAEWAEPLPILLLIFAWLVVVGLAIARPGTRAESIRRTAT